MANRKDTAEQQQQLQQKSFCWVNNDLHFKIMIMYGHQVHYKTTFYFYCPHLTMSIYYTTPAAFQTRKNDTQFCPSVRFTQHSWFSPFIWMRSKI